jgi:acetyl-CoA C-acetyltransferase
MMTAALNGLVDRYRLQGAHIDEVVGGAVVTHAKDFNLAREAVLGTRLATSTPGITLMQACGTSLQAAMGSAAKIAVGQIDSAIAVGRPPPTPYRSQAGARRPGRAARDAGKIKASAASPSSFPNRLPASRAGLTMGEHAS